MATAHDQADEMMEWYFHELMDQLCWRLRDECLYKSNAETDALMAMHTNMESDSPTRIVQHAVFGALEVSLYGTEPNEAYVERIPAPGGRVSIRAVGICGRRLREEECIRTNDDNANHRERGGGRTSERRSRTRARQRVFRAAELAASMPRVTSSF